MQSVNLPIFREAVVAALAEDIGAGDVTTAATVPEFLTVRANLVAREAMVVAGLRIAEATFWELSPDLEFDIRVEDGTAVDAGCVLSRIKGNARAILQGERVALNWVQHLSGIATLTNQFIRAVSGTTAQILDTRKTTPGLRSLEKYAVVCGGGVNH